MAIFIQMFPKSLEFLGFFNFFHLRQPHYQKIKPNKKGIHQFGLINKKIQRRIIMKLFTPQCTANSNSGIRQFCGMTNYNYDYRNIKLNYRKFIRFIQFLIITIFIGALLDFSVISSTVAQESDNSLPVVSISTTNRTILEGGSGSVTVSLNKTVQSDIYLVLNIQDNISYGNQTISNGSRPTYNSVLIEAGQLSGTFSMDTYDDKIKADEYNITVTIEQPYWIDPTNDPIYEIADSPNNSVTFVVQENDIETIGPIISVNIANKRVIEGEIASFVFTASESSTSPINIYFTTYEGVFASGQVPEFVTLPAGSTSKTLNLQTVDDDIDSGFSLYQFRLTEKSYYNIIPFDRELFFELVDNDGPVTLRSFILNEDYLTEGDVIELGVTLTPLPESNTNVRIKADFSDNTFLSSNFSKILTISPNNPDSHIYGFPIWHINIPTEDDTRNEYSWGGGFYSDTHNYYGELLAIHDNDPNAKISVEAVGSDSVAEGSSKTFRINASHETESNLTINVNITNTTGNFLAANQVDSVTLSARNTSVEFSVPTADNTEDEPNGTISVAVLAGDNYDLATNVADRSASAIVTDNDSIEVSIERYQRPSSTVGEAPESIEEGNDVNFRIWTDDSNGTDKEIYFDIVQNSTNLGDFADFLKNPAPTKITLAAGTSEVILSLETEDDDADEVDGTITVTLRTETDSGASVDYTFNSSNSSDFVTVTDDENPSNLPVISITGPDSSVSEGNVASFTLTSDYSVSLRVIVLVEGATSFYDRTQLAVTYPDFSLPNNKTGTSARIIGGLSSSFEVPTIDDDVDEANGLLRVTIQSDASYTIESDEGTAGVRVLDDDDPVISIEAVSLTNKVTEGEPVEFNFNADRNLRKTLSIGYTLTETNLSSNFLGRVSNSYKGQTKYESFQVNTRTQKLRIPTVDDETNNQDSLVTVTLVSGEDYLVVDRSTLSQGDDRTNVASTTVQEDDKITVHIVAVNTPVTEGGNVEFKIVSDIAPWENIDIKLDIVEDQNGSRRYTNSSYIGNNKIFTLLAGNTELTLPSISVSTNQVDEDNTLIKASIKSGEKYNVVDSSVDETKSDTASVVVRDDDGPLISIGAVYTSVTEANGAVARFRLYGSPAPNSDRTINLLVTEEGNFIKYGTLIPDSTHLSSQTKQLVSGQTQTDYTIDIDNDSNHEADGKITVTVLAGDRYEVTTAANKKAEVIIQDDDPEPSSPIISIASNLTSITEGEDIVYTLTATGTVTNPTVVNVNVIQTIRGSIPSSILTSRTSDDTYQTTVSFASGDTIKTLTLQTNNDSVSGTAESVKVQIVSGSGYEVVNPIENIALADKSASASVRIVDNEWPTAYISSNLTQINEGVTAQFHVKFLSTVSNTYNVKYNITEVGNFLLEPKTSDSITTNPGPTSITPITLETENDNESEDNGSITLELIGNYGYQVVSLEALRRVSININDLDDTNKRQFSLFTVFDSVNEGDKAQFKIVTDTALTSSIDVEYNATSSGNEISSSAISSPVRLNPSAGVRQSDGKYSYSLEIQTVHDIFLELDGELRVELVRRSTNSYGVKFANRSAKIVVKDDDFPIDDLGVGIIGSANTMNDGESINFQVVANPKPTDRTINLDLRRRNFTNAEIVGVAPDEIVLPANRARVEFSLKVAISDSTKGAGSFVAEIADADDADDDNPHYRPSRNHDDHEVTVNPLSVSGTEGPASSPSLIGVRNLPVISVSVVSSSVIEGSPVEFLIASDIQAKEDLILNLSSDINGNFFDDSIPETLMLLRGQTEILYSIPTIDDNINEIDGYVSITINTGSYYQVSELGNSASVRIEDNDETEVSRRDLILAAVAATIPNQLQILSENQLEAMNQRMEYAFSDHAPTFRVKNNGSSIQSMISNLGESVNSQEKLLSALLDNTSFSYNFSTDSALTNNFTVWGLGENKSIAGGTGNSSVAWDGQLDIGNLGFDAMFDQTLIGGVAMSYNANDLNFFSSSGTTSIEGQIVSSNTKMYPYLAWQSLDQSTNIHASLGYGAGNLGIVQEGYQTEWADTSILTTSISAKHMLFRSTNSENRGVSEISINGEGWTGSQLVQYLTLDADDQQFDVSQIDLALKGKHQFTNSFDASLTPELSLGIQSSTFDGNNIPALTLGSGITYVDSKAINVSMLGTSEIIEQTNLSKWNTSFQFSYDKHFDELGLNVMSKIALGSEHNLQNSIFSTLNKRESSVLTSERRINGEIKYGIKSWDSKGVISPFVGVNLTPDRNSYKFGSEFEIGSQFSINLEGVNHRVSNEIDSKSVQIGGNFKW